MRAADHLPIGQQADGGGRALGLGELAELDAQIGVARDGGGFVEVGLAQAVVQLVKGERIYVAVEGDGFVVNVRVDGVLGAGRGGRLSAVSAGAVQGVPAAPRGVRMKRSQRQRQLLTR